MSVYARDNPFLFDQALNSIYSNTLQPTELVLVVDGPVTEQLEKVIQKYLSTRNLHLVRLEANLGLAAALNEGLRHVSTEWISRADADDINLPNRFSMTYSLLQKHPEVDIVSSNILEIDTSGEPIAERRLPEHDPEIKRFARSRNPFNHMATSYRKSLVMRCGGYPHVHLKEDYALWCFMFERGAKAYNLQTVLVHATAGREMYKRRGGWRYAKAEYDMQQILVQTGLKHPLKGALDGLLRAAIYLLPDTARGLIYEKFLRHRISKPPA